jgi:hypothetical protein
MLPSPSPSAEHAVNQAVSVRETTWTDPVGDRLRAAQRAELSLRYADLNAHHGFPKPPPDLRVWPVDLRGVACPGTSSRGVVVGR